MTYWNPVERYGVERFAGDLAAAGGAGLITPDLIPDEAEPWIDAADAHGLDKVFLVAPSSTEARLQSTTAACRGFVYATAVMGVTGAREQVSDVGARARRAGPRGHRPADRGRARGLQRSPGAPRSPSSPTPSSSAARSSGPIAEAPDLDAAVKAVAALTSDLAAGVRREL